MVGGGAAGMFGAIRAKTLAPNLKVLVIEKGKPLSKVFMFSFLLKYLFKCVDSILSVQTRQFYVWQVKISGGGRCNVTNGHFVDNVVSI